MLSATGTNNANYLDYVGAGNGGWTDSTNFLTVVGAFAETASPYGTFDQGGDVFQWNESVYYGSYRGLRGGSCFDNGGYLQAESDNGNEPPSDVDASIGFRIAQVPEPASMGIVALGMAGMLVRRRDVSV